MSNIDRRRAPHEPVIVIGPRRRVELFERAVPVGAPLLVFEDLDALDQWRSASATSSGVRREVLIALRQLGCDPARLDARLQRTLEWLGEQPSVPERLPTSEHGASRRTFYRLWGAQIPEAPSQFCLRVRALHALRLEHEGQPRTDAAYDAGFRSVRDMMRAVERFARIELPDSDR